MLRLFALVGVAATATAGDPLPRYKLAPGQVLTYRGTYSFKYGEGQSAGEYKTATEWTGWVLGDRGTGVSLLAREVTRPTVVSGGKEWPRPAVTRFTLVTIAADGRFPPDPARGSPEVVSAYLPCLPKDAAEAAGGWTTVAGDDTTAAKLAGPNRIAATRTQPWDKIFVATHQSTHTFDPARGLVTKTETTAARGYGYVGTGAGTVELVGVAAMPSLADRFARLRSAGRFLSAAADYDTAVLAARKQPPAKAAGALAAALDALKAVSPGQPDAADAVAAKVADHPRRAAAATDFARRRDKLVGRPVYPVTLAGLDGKPADPSDLADKILVLDFWYRGYEWCGKAMPQLSRLAADFADQPVAVLGLNIGDEAADAEFVVKEMGLKYRTFRVSREDVTATGVGGVGTILLVDRLGFVRDLHAADSDTLRADLDKQIRDLLAKK